MAGVPSVSAVALPCAMAPPSQTCWWSASESQRASSSLLASSVDTRR